MLVYLMTTEQCKRVTGNTRGVVGSRRCELRLVSRLSLFSTCTTLSELEMEGEKQSNRAHRPAKVPKQNLGKGKDPRVRLSQSSSPPRLPIPAS